MIAPNLDSPVNNQAAQDYKNGAWFAKAQALTAQHAKWIYDSINLSSFN